HADLHKSRLARPKPLLTEQHDVTHQLRGTDVKANPLSRFDRIRRGLEQLEVTIEHRCRREQMGHGQNHSTLHLRDLDSLQIERGPVSRLGVCRSMSMHLNAAYAHGTLRWKDFNCLFFLNSTGDERTGNDRSKSFHREAAVDWKAKNIRIVFQPNFAHTG